MSELVSLFPVLLLGNQQVLYYPYYRPDVCSDCSSSSYYCAGQRLTPHNRTLEVRSGRIIKKLELKYDYDCERDDTNSLTHY